MYEHARTSRGSPTPHHGDVKLGSRTWSHLTGNIQVDASLDHGRDMIIPDVSTEPLSSHSEISRNAITGVQTGSSTIPIERWPNALHILEGSPRMGLGTFTLDPRRPQLCTPWSESPGSFLSCSIVSCSAPRSDVQRLIVWWAASC